MRFLAIDSATLSLSLALLEDQTLISEITTNTKIKHSTQLLPLIQTMMETVGWQPEDLEGVIISKGPGSYTGLRIGVTAAKVLASTLGIPLYSVPSLLALAANIRAQKSLVLPFFDARRQTVFAAAYLKDGQAWTALEEVKHGAFSDWLASWEDRLDDYDQVYFISSDLASYESALAPILYQHDHCHLAAPEDRIIYAHKMVQLPLQLEDVDTFLPDYAKLAEAEENWREKNPGHDGENYVERAD